jgi:hypothetical protein
MITKEHAIEMIALLAKEFKVPKPKFEMYVRGNRGHYRRAGKHGAIRISRRRMEEWVVLHEFAHHLDHAINKPRHSRSRYEHLYIFSKGRETYHDVPFRACLTKIAAAWYGDPAQYPWKQEYPAVRKWWESKLSTCQDSVPALDSSAHSGRTI